MKKEWLVKTLAMGIIVLFISSGVVSAFNGNLLNKFVVNKSKELLVRGHIAYAYISYSSNYTNGPCYFDVNNPGTITKLSDETVTNFLSGGTWTCDEKWYCCQYGTGVIYTVTTDTGHIETVGGGGNNLNDLAYDPVNNELYGAGETALFLIDMETGAQELIGSSDVFGIACDKNGTCYGVDSNSLYTIDLFTGEATFVHSLINFNCSAAVNAEFDIDNDILYLIGFSTDYMTSLLYICDTETGVCNLVGQFEGNSELTALAISFNSSFIPPVTTISFDPPEPDGCNGWYVSNVTVTLNATDEDGVNATYYRLDSGEWKTYESPFFISEDGEYTIEYYSIDYVGNIEDVKSSTINIDKTPPETSLEYKAWKEDCKWYVKFIFNVTDSTSGASGRVEWFLNEVIQKIDEGPGPTYEWTIKWSTDYGHSSVIFKATTWDKAGNQANESIKGSDIKSHPRSQSSTFQFINIWLIKWSDRFPFLQKILGVLG